jgi:hypothetical protein
VEEAGVAGGDVGVFSREELAVEGEEVHGDLKLKGKSQKVKRKIRRRLP